MTLSFNAIEADRQALRRRWYDQGLFQKHSLSDVIAQAVAREPGVRVGFFDGQSVSFTDIATLWSRARRLASALAAIGIGPGDPVVAQTPADEEGIVSHLAIIAAGAVLIPVVPTYGLREMSFILEQSRAKVLITPAALRGADIAERLARYDAVPSLRHVVLLGGGEPAPPKVMSFEALEALGADLPLPSPDPDSICLTIYTSGTTSAPKGVQHSHNSLLADLRSPLFDARGLFLNVLPTGHIGGLLYLLRPFVREVSQIFMHQWTAEAAARLVADHGVEEISGTPVFLLRLLEAADATGSSLASLRFFGVGGASVAPEHIRLAEERGFQSGRGYGSTEHPTLTTSVLDAPFDRRATTDGVATPGNELRIVDDAGHEVPAGMEGEIVSRGPGMFLGYTDADLDVSAFLPGGWYKSGDIGRLTSDGCLVVTDRKKDIIIRGGENISSKEVEEILCRMEAVAEAAAVAVPDRTLGEKVCAVVRLHPGCTVDLAAIQAHFAALDVARLKTPERVVIVEEFPRTPSGKIQKFALRDLVRNPGD